MKKLPTVPRCSHVRDLHSSLQESSESTSLSTTKSRALTQSLLNLDLGYSVLNEELMRRSMGLDVDRLDGSSVHSDRILTKGLKQVWPMVNRLTDHSDLFSYI